VIFVANQDLARAEERALRLGVALEAKVVVALDEHLAVDRAVRTVTNSAAFAHRFVLEDERLGLVTMTLRARLIESRHREAASGLHDVRAVRIVALDTTHFAFEDGMMLREAELGVGFDVAIQTARRVFAGIENEFPPATAAGDVQTTRAVTGFTAARADFGVWDEMHPRVRTGGELPDVIGVTGQTGLVADVIGAGNFGGDDDLARNGGTRVETHGEHGKKRCDQQRGHATPPSSDLLILLQADKTVLWFTSDDFKRAGWLCANADSPNW
jgi:hypothetical protein